MKRALLFGIFSVTLLLWSLGRPAAALAHPHILDADTRQEVSIAEFLEDLRQTRVVFVGELHDHVGHHAAQLAIIEALADDDRPLVIGLEMFRRDSQEALDRWTSGDMSFLDFIEVYNDNWSMWEAYRQIFNYARQEDVPMVGLNIPRRVTAQVSRRGFARLPAEQQRELGNVECEVSPLYEKYIRQALGGHGGHGQQFLYFCEAQILWDTVMARHIVEYLEQNPEARMVVLAGSAHAWKHGIPTRMLQLAEIDYRVVLPEVVGRIDRRNVNAQLADYLWLDVDDAGWQF
ncbi:MAG TPA: ChaN family lipoprotein [Desulfuromonadales bacterium]|nr:ChaN family lipoprotein [Desulfuromonadales bacterium]